MGPPRSLGNPRLHALLCDPGGTVHTRPYGATARPSAVLNASAPAKRSSRGSITRPTGSLSTLHLPGHPGRRKTRFRLVANLCRVEFSPTGFLTHFHGCLPATDSVRPGFPGARRVGQPVARPAPHRSGRADFPHPAPRVWDSLPNGGVVKPRQRQGIARQQAATLQPVQLSPLRAAPQPLDPGASHLEVEAPQAASVAADPVVSIVTAQPPAQADLLLGEREVAHPATPIAHPSQCPREAVFRRLTLNGPASSPAPAPIMGEAEKVEGPPLRRLLRLGREHGQRF